MGICNSKKNHLIQEEYESTRNDVINFLSALSYTDINDYTKVNMLVRADFLLDRLDIYDMNIYRPNFFHNYNRPPSYKEENEIRDTGYFKITPVEYYKYMKEVIKYLNYFLENY